MEKKHIIDIQVNNEENLVEIRNTCRKICELIGFSNTDQVKITTSVSEIARNIYEYAKKGTISFYYISEVNKNGIEIISVDQGPGIKELDKILEGKYISHTGLGAGIKGARALMNEFYIQSKVGEGTTVRLIKYTNQTPNVSSEIIDKLSAELIARNQSPKDALIAEIENQNKELLAVLKQLNDSNKRLELMNNELIETNQGVVALNNEMALKNEELDKLNQNLKSAVQQLNEKNAELKSFNYTVSHDLKAPLRGISGYSQELTRKHSENLSERGAFCVSQINTAAKQLDVLIEDLLSYARLETETVQIQNVNIKSIIENIINQRQKIIEENNIGFKLTIQDFEFKSWEHGLIHIISNLIDNAFKYSSKAEKPEVSVLVKLDKNDLYFEIKDNGIGFDMKYHDRMFELFHRLVRYEEFEGTGAGLAIVKKILAKQNGKIWAESEPGKGACFFFTLPNKK